MNVVLTAAFGWLVPGGAYLLARRYLQFALSLAIVCSATAAGIALHGANLWPQSDELQGLDSLATLMAQGGALARAMAGAPYLLARLCHYSQTFLAGQTHEYGTTLLVLAGLFNLLALADALELRKAARA
jgi:4-hydroxybenzoate polyprenyltransferase